MTITSWQRPAVVLLAAAAVVALIGAAIDAGAGNIGGFFLLPLLSGLGFAAAAAAGGRAQGLWPTALTTTGWGVLILAHFHGILLPSGDNLRGPANIVIYSVAVVVAGALAYAVIRWQRLGGSLRAVAAVVVASLVIYALALLGVPGVVGWWLYPALMIAMAVPYLRSRTPVAA